MSVSDVPGPGLAPHRWPSPFALRQWWLTIDENAQVRALVAGRWGALALHLAFLVVIAATGQLSMSALGLTGIALLAMWAVPAQKLAILIGVSLFYFVVRPYRIDGWGDLLAVQAASKGWRPLYVQAALAVGCIGFAFGYLTLVKRGVGIVAKRPVLTLIVVWFAALATAMAVPSGSTLSLALWTATGVAISSLWILAYAAVDARSKDATPVAARAGFMRPFWGGSATPIGKSFGYLNKFAAKDDDDLARTRLKALKLAVWAGVLVAVLKIYSVILFDTFGVPALQSTIIAHARGAALPTGASWAALLSNYFYDLLVISIWGHLIVATVRMVGYRIPRNTVNPLASRTLAEFWNRYFFYFKELLVDFFFYPAFVRFFKGNVKARIAFATFCAAGLGNFLYHFMRETYVFANGAFLDNLAIFQSAVFYSLALATGLIVSQLRKNKPTAADGWFAYHVRPRIGVIAFFCFLKIFDDITGEGTLLERADFALSLFGV